MIMLDTHIWVWWVHDDPRLTAQQTQWLRQSESQGLGVSAISCWEVAKLVEYGRLTLPCPVGVWISQALAYPGVRLLEFTPEIAIESTRLPGEISPRPGGPNDRRHRQDLQLWFADSGREDSLIPRCEAFEVGRSRSPRLRTD